MARQVLADTVVSISEFSRNHHAVVAGSEGFHVAVMNRNRPKFYCVRAVEREALMGKLEDVELNAIADEHSGKVSVPVRLNES